MVRSHSAAITAGATLLLANACQWSDGAPAPAKPASASVDEASSYTPAPAELLATESSPVLFTLFYLPRAGKDPAAAFERAARAEWPELRILADDAASTEPHPSAHVAVVAPEPSWIPDPGFLGYFGHGLSDAQIAAVQRSEQLLSVAFYADPGELLRAHALAMRVLARVAEETGALLWDDETREMFTLETWRARGSEPPPATPNVAKLVAIHAYRNGELVRIVTLGMRKFGYPDIVINDAPASLQPDLAAMVELACQTLVETGRLEREGRLALDVAKLRNPGRFRELELAEGGTGRIEVELAVAQTEDGDADNRLVEIVFPGPREGLAERQVAAVAELWGRDDTLLFAKSEDSELEAASARARKTLLGEIKPDWLATPHPLHHLIVKAPFATPDGGNEFMWVEVVRWNGSTIHGLLMSRPAYVPDLEEGAEVEVAEDSVFDYLLQLPDGSERGNETTRILLSRRDP